jgi:hypothetical protein
MNQKVLWTIIVVIILALGIYFVASKKSNNTTNSSSSTQSSNTQSNSSSTNQVSNSTQSLKDLLALGIAQKCSFTSNGNSGSVYLSSGKMRGDFSVTQAGKTMMSHMISDNNTYYVWTDGQTQGFKMSYNVQSSAPQPYANQSVDVNQKNNYSCSPGVVDSAEFTPPTSVNFMDYSSIDTIPGGMK